MQFCRSLEEWGRARVLNALSWAVVTKEVSALDAAEFIRRNPRAKLLLIGIYQHMGQFLCATPLIRSIRSAWPEASVHFLGNPVNSVAARANPRLDRVWVWRKFAFWQWPRQLLSLRKERFAMALIL